MTVMSIQITKAGRFLEVNTDELSDDDEKNMFAIVVAAGLKAILNLGASGITPAKIPDDAQRKEAAWEAGLKQWEALKSGTYKPGRGGRKAIPVGMSRELKTELMRQARLHVKSEIRAAGNRIGDYKAREISELAEQWLDINPQFIDEVREEMAKAATAAPKYKSIPSLAPNPEKVKANEEKKKEQGRKLAAAKAGKTPVTKAKPGTATNEQVTAMLAMKAKASGLSKPLN